MERLLTLYSEVQSTDVQWLWYTALDIYINSNKPTADRTKARASNSALINIREEFDLLFLHFSRHWVCKLLRLRSKHDGFLQIKKHYQSLIRISYTAQHLVAAFSVPIHHAEHLFQKLQ